MAKVRRDLIKGKNRKVPAKRKLINQYVSGIVKHLINKKYNVSSFNKLRNKSKIYNSLKQKLNLSDSLFKKLWYSYRSYTIDELYTFSIILKVPISIFFPPKSNTKKGFNKYKIAMQHYYKKALLKIDFKHFLKKIR